MIFLSMILKSTHMKIKCSFLLFLLYALSSYIHAQIVLVGDNPPQGSIMDGNFDMVRGSWRQAKQSPFWKTTVIEGEFSMGLHAGTLFSSNEIGKAESLILNANPAYQQVKIGDVYRWELKANLEYVSRGTLSVALVFGSQERVIADKLPLIGSDGVFEHFSGKYCATKEDAQAGLPFVRVYFYSENDIKVYLDYIKITVDAHELVGPTLSGEVIGQKHQLSWNSDKDAVAYKVFRKGDLKQGFKKLTTLRTCTFIDEDFISGKAYTYLVQSIYQDSVSSCASNIVTLSSSDKTAPVPPTNLHATAYDAEVKLKWTRSADRDVAYYIVKRRNVGHNSSYKTIDKSTKRPFFEDILPPKGVDLEYVVYAYDYSGNCSIASKAVQTRVHCIPGAAFSDLIRLMPVTSPLRSDVWGADGVLPRDVNNGMESTQWTYWGGASSL